MGLPFRLFEQTATVVFSFYMFYIMMVDSMKYIVLKETLQESVAKRRLVFYFKAYF